MTSLKVDEKSPSIGELKNIVLELENQLGQLNDSKQNSNSFPTEPSTSDLETNNIDTTLSLLFFILLSFEIILSIYINIRLLYIVCHTFSHEYKSSYYPILFIMTFLSWPTCVCVCAALTIVFSTKLYGTETPFVEEIHELSSMETVFSFVIMILFYTYPLCLSLLDFLLCVHRVFCVFGNLKLMTVWFRWFGPLVFVVCFPFLLQLVYLSKLYTMHFESYIAINGDQILFGYLMDISLKFFFSVLSVAGYSSILYKVRTIKKQLGSIRSEDDIYIVKQALPIAIFQLVFVVIGLIFSGNLALIPSIGDWTLFIEPFTFLTSTIVVPVSVIAGHPRRRKLFKVSQCCCQNGNVETIRSYEESNRS